MSIIFDRDTKQIKTATHVVFDEANYTLPMAERPPASQALIDLGYKESDSHMEASPTTSTNTVEAQIQLLTPQAKVPTRGTKHSVGYDTYSPAAHTLQPQMITKVPLDIAILPPIGSYVQLMSCSGLALKGVTCHAGVIDPDYRGNITVLLHNSMDNAIQIKAGDCIAQILFQQISTPTLVTSPQLPITDRNDKGFGSTDQALLEQTNIPTPQLPPETPIVVRTTTPMPDPPVRTDFSAMPYNIYLSTDPFDDVIPITVTDFGSHATMGMVLQLCPV